MSTFRTGTLFAFFALGLAACVPDATKDIDLGVSNAATVEGPNAACDADDLKASGAFVGPAVDAAGEPVVKGDYAVFVAVVAPPPGGTARRRLSASIAPVEASLRGRDGLLAYQTASSARCGSSYLLTFWKTDDVFATWVDSIAFVDALDDDRAAGLSTTVTFWNAHQAEGLVTWADAREHLADVGPLP